MTNRFRIITVSVAAISALAGAAHAVCPPDSVRVGSACVDKYEASAWKIAPDKTEAIEAIQAGTITAAQLVAAGAGRRGATGDDYGPACPDTAANCTRVYAVSIPGVRPAAYLTWFQAAQICHNAGKRLVTNAEWQVAAFGTPAADTDDDSTDCNTTFDASDPVSSGTRSQCVSTNGVFDTVGNLREWTSDWRELPVDCETWIAGDLTCVGGSGNGTQQPAAIVRGGGYLNGADAGIFAINAFLVNVTAPDVGFRCAR